jgi:hypothetical protein
MFRKSLLLVAAVAFLAIGLIACSESGELIQRESLLDKNWGRSYEAAKYNQILNPDAGKNLNPVEGLDGVASENAVNKYDESFKEKKGSEVTNILKLQ